MKKNYKGYIRDDDKGLYITNGKNCFFDGKNKLYIDDLYGWNIQIKILHPFRFGGKINNPPKIYHSIYKKRG